MTRESSVYVDGELFYAAHKAQEVLEMTYSAVRNQVIAGNIIAKTPKGKRQLYYRARDVERLAHDLHKLTHRETIHSDIIRIKNRDEMRECLTIAQSTFGLVTDKTLDDCMGRIEKNPYCFHAIKNGGRFVGFVGLVPLKEGMLDGVLAQSLPITILHDHIETFHAGSITELYMSIMVTRVDASLKERRQWGYRMISYVERLLEEWGHQGIIIKTIAARSDTPDGIRLLKHFGFTEIKKATPDRRTFVIDIDRSGIPVIEQYKKALEESKKSNQE